MNSIFIFTGSRADLAWSGCSVQEAEQRFNLLIKLRGKLHKIVWELYFCKGCTRTTIHEPEIKPLARRSVIPGAMAQEMLPNRAEARNVEQVDMDIFF